MFGIFSEKESIIIEDELILPALIVIDEFKEAMNIPLAYWSIDDYKNSWLYSLEDGLNKKIMPLWLYQCINLRLQILFLLG